MFCPKCGSQIADGAKFCPKCGYQIPESSQSAKDNKPDAVTGSTYQAQPPRKLPIIPIAIVGVLVVAIVAVVVLGIVGIGPATSLFHQGTGAVSEETGHSQGNYTSNISVGYGYGVSDGEYDYFISYQGGGICRAKWTEDDPEVEVIYPLQMDETGYVVASCLNIDDGWVYFSENSYHYGDNSDDDEIKIVRVRTDGSQAETVYEFEDPDSEDASYSSPTLYLFDGQLYVVASKYLRNTSNNEYEIIRMNGDGSDVETLGDLGVDGYANIVLTPDRMYYSVSYNNTSSTSQSMSTLYAQDLDGSNMSVIYESNVGSISGLTYKDGRLYFSEYNYNVDYRRLVSIAEDGSDEQQIYESSANEAAYVVMYTDDSAYLTVYDTSDGYSYAPSYLEVVPLSGEGETTQVDIPDGMYNPLLMYAGDHIILLDAGGDVASLGYNAWAMNLDGSNAKNYVESPY